MDADRLLIRTDARDELAVGGRGRIGVDDRQEVVALLLLVTGPGEEVVPRLSRQAGEGREAQD